MPTTTNNRSLYNVVLLFLRDLTATQLNTRREANRRVLILIFASLLMFTVLLMLAAQITQYDLYYYLVRASLLFPSSFVHCCVFGG
jgi:hypothetical protein